MEPESNDVSQRLETTLLKLTETVDKLQHTVERFAESQCATSESTHTNDAGLQKIIEEEEPWELIRDTIKEQDEETVESWKDELNYLLVFAGLFSAVVTAFTIESYQWLQQDPGDSTNALLAQLSLQISRFTIAPSTSSSSPTLVNSTAPALSLAALEASFTPVSYAVAVNTLWVLSLTLSLISAFFAITAQQWLRQLRLPPEMPVRRAVQLLAFRSDGLKTWQVPSIISLLPLLLQVAVVLFLIGLFLLLQSLNATVTIAFSVAAVFALACFLITTALPLISTHCPYKSPLVPTILVSLQCMTYPLAAAAIPVVYALKTFLNSSLGESFVLALPGRAFWVDVYVDKLYNSLFPYIRSFGRHMLVDMGQFWLSREHQAILSAYGESRIHLERTALIRTLLSIPSRPLSRLSLKPLGSLLGAPAILNFRHTVLRTLYAFHPGLRWRDIAFANSLNADVVKYARGWLPYRHHHLLWQCTQQDDAVFNKRFSASWDGYRHLALFHELDQAVADTPQRFWEYLLCECTKQKASTLCSFSDTVPACLLLDTVLHRKYTPSNDDAVTLQRYAIKMFRSQYRGDDRHVQRSRLVATTLCLIAQHASGNPISASLLRIVNITANYLDESRNQEVLKDELSTYYLALNVWSKVNPAFASPARIVLTLCKALVNYASMDPLALYPSHIRTLGRISGALRDVCNDTRSVGQPEMQKARQSLDRLDLILENSDGLRFTMLGENGTSLESCMKALVRAEARLLGHDANGRPLDAIVLFESSRA